MAKSKEQTKEEKSQEWADLRKIPDAFKLNLANNPDRFYEIIQGTYKPPKLVGEPARITSSVITDKWVSAKSPLPPDAIEDEDDGMVEPIKRNLPYTAPPTPKKASKFASLTQTLETFPFSADENKFKSQLAIVEKHIKTAMQEITVTEVANNTKTAFGQYFEKAFKIPGGIKIAFNFEKKKFTVEAYGAFSGDETICIFAENEEIKGCVMRIADNQQDILNDFKVVVGAK